MKLRNRMRHAVQPPAPQSPVATKHRKINAVFGRGRHAEGLSRAILLSVVAVGTPITRRPPRRSVQAVLPHTALTLDSGGKRYSPHIAQSVGHANSRTVSGTCQIERCSPWSTPFPPQPPRKTSPRCSAGSSVLWRSPTSPERARPPFGLSPSRTGLDLSTKTSRRSPGSRACCFSACAGSSTTQDRLDARV
jgi:hypothetical protein